MKLTAKARGKIPRNDFALPGGRFPIENASHARAALSGASRALHAGNITASQKAVIDAKADRKLGK